MPFKLEIIATTPFELERDMIVLGQMAQSYAQLRGFAEKQMRANQAQGALTEEAQAAVAETETPQQEPPAEKPKPRGRPAKPRTIVDTGSGGVPMPPEPLDPKLAEPPAATVEEDPLDVPEFLKKDKPAEKGGIGYVVPKDATEMRQQAVDLVTKKGAAAVDEIFSGKLKCPKLKDLPAEKYEEAAKLIAEAMTS